MNILRWFSISNFVYVVYCVCFFFFVDIFGSFLNNRREPGKIQKKRNIHPMTVFMKFDLNFFLVIKTSKRSNTITIKVIVVLNLRYLGGRGGVVKKSIQIYLMMDLK